MYVCEGQKWDLEYEVRKRDWEVLPKHKTKTNKPIFYPKCPTTTTTNTYANIVPLFFSLICILLFDCQFHTQKKMHTQNAHHSPDRQQIEKKKQTTDKNYTGNSLVLLWICVRFHRFMNCVRFLFYLFLISCIVPINEKHRYRFPRDLNCVHVFHLFDFI